jgi:hypothetical protein
LTKQIGDGAGEQFRIVVAGQAVKVAERKATPGSAQNTEPSNAVMGVEEGMGQRQGVKHLRAGGKLFEIDGAEGNGGVAEGCRDGDEGIPSAG